MGFIGRLISFVFWVLIVSWVIKLVGRLLSRGFAGSGHGDAAPQARSDVGQDATLSSKRLVRDPVCGMHMAEELALQIGFNSFYYRARENSALALVGTAQLLPKAVELKDRRLLESMRLHLSG